MNLSLKFGVISKANPCPSSYSKGSWNRHTEKRPASNSFSEPASATLREKGLESSGPERLEGKAFLVAATAAGIRWVHLFVEWRAHGSGLVIASIHVPIHAFKHLCSISSYVRKQLRKHKRHARMQHLNTFWHVNYLVVQKHSCTRVDANTLSTPVQYSTVVEVCPGLAFSTWCGGDRKSGAVYFPKHDCWGWKLEHMASPRVVLGVLLDFGADCGCGLWEVSPLLLEEAFESDGWG